ncbi:MAG: NAD-dependent epimerase/dehydratase family protein [Chloroflexota bacterium]
MTVVITGGAGFIGVAVTRELLNAGYKVLAFDRAEPPEKVRNSLGEGVTYVKGEIQNRQLVRDLIKEGGADPIIHLAGILTAGCDRDPDLAMAVNVHGFYSVLEAAREFGMRRVVMASTIGVYGRGLPQPINEDMPTQPDGWYGVTKLMAETMGLMYANRYGLDFRATRFSAVTGAGRSAGSGSASLFTSFIPEKAALGVPYEIEVEPTVTYPVVYIKDAARALFTLTTVASAPRRIYNIGSGTILTSAMVDAVKQRVPGAQFTYKPDPTIMAVVGGYKGWDISIKRAEEDLGWRPAYNTEQMVDDIIAVARAGK